MSSHRKRHSSRSPSPFRSSSPAYKRPSNRSPPPPPGPFPSYLDDSRSLPPKIRLLCSLIASTPSTSIESALSSLPPHTVHPISSADVESVLQLSYSHPSSAVKFFRWAGTLLRDSLSPYAWNLAVDILGKNRLFDPMWDAVRSMHSQQSLLSLATFASIFSSYSSARIFQDALNSFDIMQSRYNVPRDTPALNSLLSALCRDAHTSVASDFLILRSHEVPPDSDSYAILMEGWESERQPRQALKTFYQMINRLGYNPANTPAYDSFLCTLLQDDPNEALKYLSILKDNRCYPSAKFLRTALHAFLKKDDAKGAVSLWDDLVGRNGIVPDTDAWLNMISLQCRAHETEAALRYLDEMVTYGAFPDGKIYELVLLCMVNGKRPREVAAIFNEMVKNEFVPSEAGCEEAIKFFFAAGDWESVEKVWKCMVENGYSTVEENGNALVVKLMKDVDRLPESCRFAEDMIDRNVKLSSANLSRLKASLLRIGKGNIYDYIFKKWKLR